MRCVSYTRTVSCMESGEIPKDIISQQNQKIQDYIKKRGWTLGKKYSDRRKDAFEETAYLQMKMDAIAREFDCVVMDSMFRCGRNSNVAAEMLESMFVPAGIHFAPVMSAKRKSISIWMKRQQLIEINLLQIRYENIMKRKSTRSTDSDIRKEKWNWKLIQR